MVAILAVVGAIGLLLVTAPGDPPPADPVASTPGPESAPTDGGRTPLERISVGRGARGAKVIRQQGTEVDSLVIFFHGWKVASRSDYRNWMSHLAREGNTVIFPTYQNSTTPPAEVLGNGLSGVRSALELIGDPQTVVAAGHSAGAALAADYAAVASAKGLPVPSGVLAIYPGRAILGYPEGIPPADLSQIDSSTRVIAMSSPLDTIVGEQPAEELLETAVNVPAARKRLVSVSSPVAGDHLAPASETSASKRTFWRTLDRLLARV